MWWELCLRPITAANGCIRAEPHGRAITGSRGIVAGPRPMESESSQETESHGQCNQPLDLATFTTAAAVSRSCFANSPLGWEAIQDDRRGGFCEKHPFPGVVLYCPHLWSHSFAPDLPSPHVWLLPGGKSALTLLCRILLLPGRQIS